MERFPLFQRKEIPLIENITGLLSLSVFSKKYLAQFA